MSDGVFGASSGQRNRVNPDGSRSVYCSYCQEFIGYSFENVMRAICVLCQYAEEGKPITEEALRTYKLSKANRVDVSAIALPPEPPDLRAMGVKKKFNLVDIAGDMMRAVGKFAATESSIPEPEKLPSVKLAKEKRRGRLFEGLSLGSMEDVDRQLGEKK